MSVKRSRSVPASTSKRPETRQHKTSKWSTVKRNVADGLSNFFGVALESEEDDDKDILLQKWMSRSHNLHASNIVFGTWKRQSVSPSLHPPPSPQPQPLPPPSPSHDSAGTAVKYKVQVGDGRDQTDVAYHSSTFPLKRPARLQRFLSLNHSTSVPVRSYQPVPRDSVLKMTWNGIRQITNNQLQSVRRPVRPVLRCRSVRRSDVSSLGKTVRISSSSPREDLFFNIPVPTSMMAKSHAATLPLRVPQQQRRRRRRRSQKHLLFDEMDSVEERLTHLRFLSEMEELRAMEQRVSQHGLFIQQPRTAALLQPVDASSSSIDERRRIAVGMKRIGNVILDEVLDNLNREVGVGFVGRCLNWHQRTSLDSDIKKEIDKLTNNEHRPFFTYWVTFVQIVCFIVAVSVYGVSTVGVSETLIEGEVLTRSLSVNKVSYLLEDNMWIGPRQADLIHLGARYSPCMRSDANVEMAIASDRVRENASACCILNDGSGCFQSDLKSCSQTLATWLKWNGTNNPQLRSSGSVCGQDPKFCLDPPSLAPFDWLDEIVSWPVCLTTAQVTSRKENRHMTCPIVGRPCCVGIKGECIITTREVCSFLRGFFHDDLFLCSQVSCMNEICAMISFFNVDQPDQFYRLWTSLFIHAGLFQLLLSVLFQVFIMRDLEKLAGWLRVCIIYVISGIGGSLGSAIFIPYHVEAGPSGSQFGLLACLFTDLINSWRLIAEPKWALGKLTIITVVLFVVGFLPMIDNYAHLFGFIFGFLLSFALLPYAKFGLVSTKGKVIGIVISLVVCICLLNILIVLFYVIPIYSCPGCQYFNCIPFTETFCKSMEVKIVRDEDFSNIS